MAEKCDTGAMRLYSFTGSITGLIETEEKDDSFCVIGLPAVLEVK